MPTWMQEGKMMFQEYRQSHYAKWQAIVDQMHPTKSYCYEPLLHSRCPSDHYSIFVDANKTPCGYAVITRLPFTILIQGTDPDIEAGTWILKDTGYMGPSGSDRDDMVLKKVFYRGIFMKLWELSYESGMKTALLFDPIARGQTGHMSSLWDHYFLGRSHVSDEKWRNALRLGVIYMDQEGCQYTLTKDSLLPNCTLAQPEEKPFGPKMLKSVDRSGGGVSSEFLSFF